MGRLTPKPDGMLTMRDLLNSGLISQVRDGVKLLAKVIGVLQNGKFAFSSFHLHFPTFTSFDRERPYSRALYTSK